MRVSADNWNQRVSVSLQRCQFIGCKTREGPGGAVSLIINEGGTRANATVHSCLFENCLAVPKTVPVGGANLDYKGGQGGAMYVRQSEVDDSRTLFRVHETTFRNCTSTGDGGGAVVITLTRFLSLTFSHSLSHSLTQGLRPRFPVQHVAA